MLAMAAARTGQPALAIDMLMHPSAGFQFDEHGLATGGPFPYFPSNGALLTAVAMMCGGWGGSEGEAPGFRKTGAGRFATKGLCRCSNNGRLGEENRTITEKQTNRHRIKNG
mgnify:CR=1 FL=1